MTTETLKKSKDSFDPSKIRAKKGDYLIPYLRSRKPHELSKYERKLLQTDTTWKEANQEQAKQLEALIGKTVTPVEERESIDGRTRFRPGMKLEVLDRWLDELLVYSTTESIHFLVHEDWVKLLPTPRR